jgi:ribosomal protein RSM22 (predicted rRNA methylase)
MKRQIPHDTLSQVTASIYYFFQESGVFIPDSLEVNLQKHLAHDWSDVAPLGWLVLEKLRGETAGFRRLARTARKSA